MNEANIRRIIDWIKADEAKHFKMASYVGYNDNEAALAAGGEIYCQTACVYVECKTAFCIAGYANLLRLEDEGVNWRKGRGSDFYQQFGSQIEAGEFIGLSCDNNYATLEKLFLMIGSQFDGEEGRTEFDNLPREIKAKTAINVLENLIETNWVDWDKAYQDAIA